MTGPTTNTFLRPIKSESGGIQSRVLHQPKKRADPIAPTFHLGSHIKDSFIHQLSRDLSEFQSTAQDAILGSLEHMFDDVHSVDGNSLPVLS